jgi:hypothetical protein
MSGFGKDEIFQLLEGFLADQPDPNAREKIIQDSLEKFGVSAELIAAAKARFCVVEPPPLAPPRLNVDLGSTFDVGCAAHFQFHLICPGYREKPKVTAKLRLMDQDDWCGAPTLSTEEPGYWIFDENFILTKGGRDCPPGTYGIDLTVEFRSAPVNSAGRFLRASLKIQVHDSRSAQARTLEIDGEGLSIINLQGHDLRGFNHVKLKGGDKSVVNLHHAATATDHSSAGPATNCSSHPVNRYVELPLKRDHDRTEDGLRRSTAVAIATPTNRLMFSFADDRRVLVFAQDTLRLGRNRERGNDVVLRYLPRTPEHDRSSLNISKSHFQLMLTKQGLGVRDLGSTFGTVLNGRPLTNDRPQALTLDYDGQVHRLLLADSFELALRIFATPEDHSRLQMQDASYADAIGGRVSELWEKSTTAAVEAVRIERSTNLPKEEYVLLFRQAWIGSSDDCAIRLTRARRHTRAARLFHLGNCFWLERLEADIPVLVDGRETSLGELIPLSPGQTLSLNGDDVLIGEATQDLSGGGEATR